VVIIVNTKLATEATAQVILFSSALQLGWAQLIDYYQLLYSLS
jgi:hypothetical protein